jgi:hypothetical protein
VSSQQQPTAVAVARAHVEAWAGHDFDTARAALAPDVRKLSVSVDPDTPHTDVTGADAYMERLTQFGQMLVPGTTTVESVVGDETRALLRFTSRVKMGPDAPEVLVHGARLYLIGEDRKIAHEQVIVYVAAE